MPQCSSGMDTRGPSACVHAIPTAAPTVSDPRQLFKNLMVWIGGLTSRVSRGAVMIAAGAAGCKRRLCGASNSKEQWPGRRPAA